MIEQRRVLIVITNPDRAGAQKHVESLVKSSFEGSSKYRFTVVTGGKGYLTEACSRLGVRVVLVKALKRNLSLFSDLKALLALTKIVRSEMPDLVHLHSAKAGLLGRIAAKFVGIPCIYTVHGWAFAEGVSRGKKWVSLFFERVFRRLVDHTIVVSNYDRDLALAKGVLASSAKVSVIHNGIDYQPKPQRKANSGNELQLTTITRLAKQKNIDCMLKAVALLPDNCRLRIVGYGPEEHRLKLFAKELGISNQITFVGEVANVTNELLEADLFLMSSKWEGLPIALLEAIRAGLPIIATNVGGVGEIVEDRVNGFLVPSNDHRKMAECIMDLAANEQQRNDFSSSAYIKFKESFQTVDMIQKTLEVYDEVLDYV